MLKFGNADSTVFVTSPRVSRSGYSRRWTFDCQSTIVIAAAFYSVPFSWDEYEGDQGENHGDVPAVRLSLFKTISYTRSRRYSWWPTYQRVKEKTWFLCSSSAVQITYVHAVWSRSYLLIVSSVALEVVGCKDGWRRLHARPLDHTSQIPACKQEDS